MTRKRHEQILWDVSSQIPSPAPPETTNAWKRVQNAIAVRETIPDHAPGNLRFAWRSPRFAYSLGAIVLLLGLGWFVSTRLSSVSFHTGRGEQQSLLLPDSSSVRLNQSSVLAFRRGFLNRDRLVRLSGEAYFKVRSGDRPFVITTSIGTIQVVGTEFNVACRNDRLEVAVNNGIVAVTAGPQGVDSTVRVSKGEMVVCRSGSYPESPRPIRFDHYPGWLTGRLLMNQMPIPAVCEEIEESSGVAVRLEDTTLSNVTVTGVLEGHDADALVATLCSLTGRHFRYDNDGYVIY